MNTIFNGIIVETNGVRTIAGGGTNANTATGALANLGGYPASNPNGYITGINSSNFYTRDNPSGYITGDLSTLYPRSNPSGFISGDLSSLYPRSNPSGFISGVSQFNYISGDLIGNLLSPSLGYIQGNPISAASPSGGQTLQWNGDAWVPGSVPNGGNGGGGKVYYFDFANTTGIAPTGGLPASGDHGISLLGRSYEIGSGQAISNDLDPRFTDRLLCSFVTASGDPGVSNIPAGLWDFNIWASVNSANTTQSSMKAVVNIYNPVDSTYRYLASSDEVYLYETDTVTQYILNATVPQTGIASHERIYIGLYGKKYTTNDRKITVYFDSYRPSHVHTTLPSVAGNGIVKVIDGVMQSPASKIIDNDINANAAIVVSKLSQATARILGRTTAGVGAVEEISIGTGLSLSAGTLTATPAGTLPVANGGTGRTVGNYSIYGLEIHVGKDGNDTTGDGTLINPVLTITKALTLVAAGRNTVIVHPGEYIEDPTVTSTNTTIATSELTGANTLLTGTLTLNAAARVSGLKMSNLTITGVGNTYISNCTVDTQVIKSGTNYVEIINSELQCTAGVQITGAGIVSILGNKCWGVAVSNAGAIVLIKDCFQVRAPSVTAGSLQFDGCAIFAAPSTTIAVTSSALTNITLANSFVLNSTSTNVGRVSLGGNYSILNLVYDKANSTFTGTNLNAVDYFSVINAEKIGVNTVADATVGLKLDSTGVKFNDGTVQTTAGGVDWTNYLASVGMSSTIIENLPRNSAINNDLPMTVGTLYAVMLTPVVNTTISQLSVNIAVSGANATLFKLGIYTYNESTEAATLVTSTASETAKISFGLQTLSLSSSTTLTAGVRYAFVILQVGGNGPSISGVSIPSNISSLKPVVSRQVAGQTDLQTSITISTNSIRVAWIRGS
jgi:hypothetical protein